jgi:predicted amidohydrolase
MRIACIQFAPVFGDLDANTQTITEAIRTVKADVVVVPELATSGYFFATREEARIAAEPVDGDHISLIVQTARDTGSVVICGFAESTGEHVYNSAVIAGPDIETQVYRKTHLFYKERYCFDEGNTGFFCTPLPHLDCTLGTMICYDWRFPESARTLALQGADLVVCPSNLVTHLWRMAMPVRALENKVFLAVANRIGAEHNGGEDVAFNGLSAIYGTNGETLAETGPTEMAIITADIDPSAARTKSFNSINDIFADRRPETYRT